MNYKDSRDAAWKMLLKSKVSSLPVNVKKICKSEGIRLVSYSSGARVIHKLGLESNMVGNDAFSVGKVIFYDDKTSIGRQRFSIAHELGHIVLHCSERVTVYNREPSPNDDPIEAEANVFASRLLAPLCVLHYLNVKSAQEISELCNISSAAAKIRFERLCAVRERDRELRLFMGRGCFLLSPLEREVYRMFEGYIRKNRKD